MGLHLTSPVGWLCVALLVGCAPDARVKGTLGGDEVIVNTAMFSEHPAAFGSDGLIFVVLTALPNACADYAYYQQQAEALSDPEELAALWANTFPADFWEVVVVARVPDPAVSLVGQQYIGLDWYELLDIRSRFFARFTHNRALRDGAWFDGEGPTADYLDEFLSHQGTLTIQDHEPGVRLRGVVDTLVVDTETVEPQGVVQVRFDADFCNGILGL